MTGIAAIGAYVAEQRIDSAGALSRYGIEADFLDKLGIRSVARKEPGESASDLCCKAFDDLLKQLGPTFDPAAIECLCVCTQNGDHTLPHTSAILQSKLGLPEATATFDLSLGCSGYPYGLSVLKGFMAENNFSRGLLFTADPYSDILDHEDKNTSLLFGDAATVTLLADNPIFMQGRSAYTTLGGEYDKLIKSQGEPLFMDGRGIFNFAMRHVPSNIRICLERNGCPPTEVDQVILHQANKYMVANLEKRLGMPGSVFPYGIEEYGNTVSSSIPLILRDELGGQAETMLLVGFGVGLSIASILLRRS